MNRAAQRLKAALRRQLRAYLKGLSPEAKAAAAHQACARLRSSAVWYQASRILFYAPLPDELDLSPLWPEALQAHKVVALPRFAAATGTYEARLVRDLAQDLVVGQFGIREPHPDCPAVALNRLDLFLVPGVAFDPNGRRLGRGHGYYDRLLAGVGGFKCGVGFDGQILDAVPREPSDVLLDCILTPTRWCWASQRAVVK
jgi:5-formyltetrahydrofolate cyclo-ligase